MNEHEFSGLSLAEIAVLTLNSCDCDEKARKTLLAADLWRRGAIEEVQGFC